MPLFTAQLIVEIEARDIAAATQIVDAIDNDIFSRGCKVSEVAVGEKPEKNVLDFDGGFPLDFLRPDEKVRSGEMNGCSTEVIHQDGEVLARLQVGDRLIRSRDGTLTVESGSTC